LLALIASSVPNKPFNLSLAGYVARNGFSIAARN